MTLTLSFTPSLPSDDDEDFDCNFDYRAATGKLLFLEKSTRPDIAFAVHQCARFSAHPKQSHGRAIKRIGRYLVGTKDRGLVYHPNNSSFECWADADFCGLWDPDSAHWDVNTARSRSGYIITYAGCPIVWSSKLQSTISLSSTEAEYVCLSEALRSVIPMMELLKEAKEHGFDVLNGTPAIRCRAFEDNSGALELANTHKFRPRTKHLNTKFHHFRDYVRRKLISVHHVRSANMLADALTKPLADEVFCRLRDQIMGWVQPSIPFVDEGVQDNG